MTSLTFRAEMQECGVFRWQHSRRIHARTETLAPGSCFAILHSVQMSLSSITDLWGLRCFSKHTKINSSLGPSAQSVRSQLEHRFLSTPLPMSSTNTKRAGTHSHLDALSRSAK